MEYLGREKLNQELQAISKPFKKKEPEAFDFDTNLFNMLGKKLYKGEGMDINKSLLKAHFGFDLNPTENLSLEFDKNVKTDEVPWKQDYRIALTYNF